MRKILMGFALLCVCTDNGFAGCNSAITLMYKGNQKPEHNEFLYENESQWLASKQGWENTRHQTSGDGKGFECDEVKSASCTPGEVITMNAGHYFMGQKINQARKYQCWGWWSNGGTDDKWVVVDDGMCNTRQFGDIPVGGAYGSVLTKEQCSGYKKTDETHGVEFQLRCEEGRNLKCYATKCDNANMSPDSNGICVEQTPIKPTPQPKKSCREQRKGWSPEAIACCDTGDEGYLSDDRSHCICKNGKEFQIVNGTGRCVNKGGTEPIEPQPKTCKDKVNMDANCNCTPLFTHVGSNGMCECDDENARLINKQCSCSHIIGARMENGHCKCGEHQEIRDGKCQDSKEWSIEQVKIEISGIIGKLNGTAGTLKRDVWKDADGEFNTARLASDSIAGVVLGTAGGIITAKVVKKNQLEKGFEDIKCSIGGQSVASYGDTMNVGLQ